MAMETDSYYEIGSTHKACQDYCVSIHRDNIAFAILSDGCSLTKDSNIGACLLSIIAQNVILHLKSRTTIDSSSYITSFSNILISKLIDIQKSLNISYHIFDATLLISIIENNHVLCFGWGDGFFISKDTDDRIIVKDISYYDEAPYYPSYELNSAKKDLYASTYGKDGFITKSTTCINKNKDYLFSNSIQINNSLSPLLIAFERLDDIKSITLCSDGIKTYYDNKDTNKKRIDPLFIIPKILDYKSTKGEFVTRRMSRLKKDMERDGFLHSDDISCTTIIL